MENYVKVIYKVDEEDVSKEEALSDGMYSIYYYLKDNFVDKIENYDDEELYKVIYLEREEPFDKLLNDHFNEYKNIDIEIRTKEIKTSNNQRMYKSYIYRPEKKINSNMICLYFERILDNNGNLIKEFRLDKNGNKHGWDEYIYDEEGELEKIREYTNDNKLINEQIFSE